MTELVRLASRVAVGTAVYVLIVVLAALLPPAAGLMLTFPALNGLAFFYSDHASAGSIARSMLWMPVVNGTLCAGYIVLFLLLDKTLAPTGLAWGLLAVIVGIWFTWVTRRAIRNGIERESQFRFAVVSTFAGFLLATLALFELHRMGLSLPRVALTAAAGGIDWIVVAIERSEPKIAMFALTLAIFAAAIQYWRISDSTRGILAGLPIVPFGGLVSVAGDTALSADARSQIFLGMATSIWLGPAVAIWFIYGFSRHLGARSKASPRADALSRFGGLLLGWALTLGVIVALAVGIEFASARL